MTRHTDDPAAGTGLPQSLRSVIAEVVRRTKLRRGERASVARELIAHFADGLDAGRTPEELIESFGDPAAAARLVRRAKKRCRGPLWHAWVWSWRGFAGVFGALAVLYGVNAARYFGTQPVVTVDYVADLQKEIDERVREEGGATWPEWVEIWSAIARANQTSVGTGPDGEELMLSDLWFYDVWNDAARAAIDEAAPIAAEARALALDGRPLGWPHSLTSALPASYRAYLRTRDDRRAAEWEAFTGVDPFDPSLSNSMFKGPVPYYRDLRRTSGSLCSDARRAVEIGDIDRFVENTLAVLALASYSREYPVLIGVLVHHAIAGIGAGIVRDQLAQNPTLLESSHATRLAHAFAAIEPDMNDGLIGERAYLYDILQRVYSDDGAGDGVFTANIDAGTWRWFFGYEDEAETPALINPALGPVAVSLIARRSEARSELDRLLELAADWGSTPPWERTGNPIGEWAQNQASTLRYQARHPIATLLLPLLLPRNVCAAGDRLRMERDSALVAIALSQHFTQHSAWPASLDELVPHVLPSVPRDIFDGQPLRYRLGERGPVVYSIGADRDDDGGRWPAATGEWTSDVSWWTPEPNTTPRADGDWILWRLDTGEASPEGE